MTLFEEFLFGFPLSTLVPCAPAIPCAVHEPKKEQSSVKSPPGEEEANKIFTEVALSVIKVFRLASEEDTNK